jgi:AraC-like DNA-binding protein
MRYYTIEPPESLRYWVRSFWVLEGAGTEALPFMHRSMADGCPELVFHYKGRFRELSADDRSELSYIAGLHAQSPDYTRFRIEEPFGIFGVYLYPYALAEWLQVPATEFTGHQLSLDELPGKSSGRQLMEEMMLASDHAQRVQVISRYLEGRLRQSKQVAPGINATIRQLVHQPGAATITELAASGFLSVRQFERNFKAASGFTPKLFARINRFHRVLQQYGGSFRSMAGLAYDCGYYDQSHFIHEFRQFSGHDPKQFFSGAAEGSAWRDA